MQASTAGYCFKKGGYLQDIVGEVNCRDLAQDTCFFKNAASERMISL